MKPWSRRVDLGKQIAAGVHYLHSHSPPAVHCDLKSKNVLLKKRGRWLDGCQAVRLRAISDHGSHRDEAQHTHSLHSE